MSRCNNGVPISGGTGLNVNDDVNFNGYRITGLGNPIDNQDAATKFYVDAAVSGIPPIDLSQLEAKTQNQTATPNNTNFQGVLTVNGQPIGSSTTLDEAYNNGDGSIQITSGSKPVLIKSFDDNQAGFSITDTIGNKNASLFGSGLISCANQIVDQNIESNSYTQVSGDGTFSIQKITNGTRLFYQANFNPPFIQITTNSTIPDLEISQFGVAVNRNITPIQQNTLDIGASNNKFKDVWALNGNFNNITTTGNIQFNGTGTIQMQQVGAIQIQNTGTVQIQPTGLLTLKACSILGELNMSNNKIVGLSQVPITDFEASNKKYVDDSIQNIDYSTVIVNTSFNEDMTNFKPIGVLSPGVVYNQGVAIEIPQEGGVVDYPSYNISNGGVLEFTFSFPSGFNGLIQSVELGDSSNNSYLIRYRPSNALNQLTVLATINGSSSSPFQATVPAGITAWKITYTTSNLQIEGKIGAGAYVSYINGAITPAVLNAGINIGSSGPVEGSMNISSVIFTGSDNLATKGDATASFDRLSTYRKRYDEDTAPIVILQDNKPITYSGVGAYTLQIAKDQLGFNAPLRGNAPVEINVPTDYYNRKWDITPFTAILSLEDTKIEFNLNGGFRRYWGYPIFLATSTASFKFKTTGTSFPSIYVGLTDNPTDFDGLVGFNGQNVGGTIYINGVSVGGATNEWFQGDECEFRIIGQTWQIYKNGIPTGSARGIIDNGKPFYFTIINNETNGNVVTMEITEVITNYVVTPTKQMSVEGSIECREVLINDIKAATINQLSGYTAQWGGTNTNILSSDYYELSATASVGDRAAPDERTNFILPRGAYVSAISFSKQNSGITGYKLNYTGGSKDFVCDGNSGVVNITGLKLNAGDFINIQINPTTSVVASGRSMYIMYFSQLDENAPP